MILPPIIKPNHLAIWFGRKYNGKIIWVWEVRRREGCYIIKAPHRDPIILSEEGSHLRIRYGEINLSIPQTDRERILLYFSWVAEKFVREGDKNAEKVCGGL